MWDDFKIFLRWSLNESKVFVNDIWKKIRTISQYQLEKVIDWATYLEHLQAVLKEFNVTATSNKDLLIYYFWHKLRPSIRAQINKREQDLKW